jgi:hypothetical protein
MTYAEAAANRSKIKKARDAAADTRRRSTEFLPTIREEWEEGHRRDAMTERYERNVKEAGERARRHDAIRAAAAAFEADQRREVTAAKITKLVELLGYRGTEATDLRIRLTVMKQGETVTAAHHRITKTSEKGRAQVLAPSFDVRARNAPNARRPANLRRTGPGRRSEVIDRMTRLR